MTVLTGVGHLLAALVLLCGFGLLAGRRITILIRLLAWQGAAVAMLASWIAWQHGQQALWLTAALTLVLKAGLVPIALTRQLRRLPLPPFRPLEPFRPLLLGLGLSALAILVTGPALQTLSPLIREQLAVGLAVCLLGIQLIRDRHERLAQVIGIFALENGVLMAAISTAGLPLVLEIALALSLLGLLALSALTALGGQPEDRESDG